MVEYCEKHAKAEDIGAKPAESSDEELSEDDDNDDNGSEDEEVVGKADP